MLVFMSTCCWTEVNSTKLLGELIGIERIERILVLQLRGQQGQKRIEIVGELRQPGIARTGAAVGDRPVVLVEGIAVMVVMVDPQAELPFTRECRCRRRD